MTSQSLNTVVAKIHASSSNLNLYRNLDRNDRINLNTTPLDQNYTDSAKGLVTGFTPSQFQSFDYGRSTYQDISQEQDCVHQCIEECQYSKTFPLNQCKAHCVDKCVNQSTKDFI